MIICTDNTAFAGRTLLQETKWQDDLPTRYVAILSERIFGHSRIHGNEIDSDHEFRYLFIVQHADRSQYDTVVELCKENVDLPHGVLCLAGEGNRFHGQRNRQWDSPPGNIYLTAYFAPRRRIDSFGSAFVILPAVSVIDAIDSMSGLERRASTKWVNDILIDDAKVAGVLTYTQAMGSDVTGVVLGIGLNVETAPKIEADRFALKAGCLRDFSPDPDKCTLPTALNSLINCLSRNYRLITANRYADLLDMYRSRSAIIGRQVTICADDTDQHPEILASGTVKAIGDNLELYLEGWPEPVSRGRLIIEG
jgi:biotin-[acetyl-CoA-carboxylase] ligase BirA-like protein